MSETHRSGGETHAGAADVSRSAEDAELFVRIYRALEKEPRTPFEEVAREIGGGMSAQKISTFLERMEEQLGTVLVERRPKSGKKSLTPAAKEAYDRLEPALESLQRWLRPDRRELIKIGAPNLLVQTVLPKIMPSYRRLLDEAGIRADIRIIVEPDPDQVIDKIAKDELDFALIWLHDEISRYSAHLGNAAGRVQLEENCFKVAFDILMVCPPGHKFIDEASGRGSQRGSDPPWRLDLAALSDQLVYMLPVGRQPLRALIPPPSDPKLRVVQPNYSSIISMVRCHVAEGIGLVPAIYPELNEMMRKGQIFYAGITYTPPKPEEFDEDRLKIRIGCITKSGIAHLSDPAQRFFELARRKFKEIAELDYMRAKPESVPMELSELKEFKHCWFVMQPKETFGVPEWFRGSIEWIMDGDGTHMDGTFTAYTHDDYVFKIVDVRLSAGQFKFEAEGVSKNIGNTISCTFNMNAPSDDRPAHDRLVGVWSGKDDRGLATVAPMVLSREEIDLESARLSVNRVSFRFLPNAETEGKRGASQAAAPTRSPAAIDGKSGNRRRAGRS